MTTSKEDFTAFHTLYGDLYLQELALESEAKEEAENHLRKSLELAKQDGEAGQSRIAEGFIKHSWESCRHNVRALIAEVQTPKKTTQGLYRAPMEDLLAIYDGKEDELENLMVLSGISRTIDNLFMTPSRHAEHISKVAERIGRAIKLEADIERFLQWEEEQGADVKWLTKSLDKGISQRVRDSYKIAYATNRMHKEGYAGLPWSSAQAEALGAKVLEMIVKGSDYFVLTDTLIDNKKMKAVGLTDWFQKAWETNENKLLANAIKHLPTIIPPKAWTTPYDGGYYGESMLGAQLIRMRGFYKNKFIKRYNQRLHHVNLSNIYSALNALQDTPFVINGFVLDTLKDIYVSGGELGGVPRTEPIPTLPKLPDTATEEELKEHKKKAIGIYKQEEARKSKALRCLVAIKTAEKFTKYEKFYFPWNVDYRGRCYPIPTALSPQGDDIQKSLLLFANPTPLASDDDVRWLAIHGANLSGNDKITFAERIAWVEENTTNIIASADDPLGYKWWYEVSKGDYPMEFLAFCNEWKNLKAYKQEHGTAKGFMSSLPLAFDGTCSGLQHFSALLRDEIGGAAVNLIPSDKVQDIYSIVADKVNVVLLKDCLEGTEDNQKTDKAGNVVYDTEGRPKITYGTKTLARNWVAFNRIKCGRDGITRKVCKRSVMTLAYGSRQYGFKENLLEDIIHPYVLNHPEDNPFDNEHQAAVYMAKLIWDSVATTVVKAVEGMEWLQKVAGLICKNDEVVTWLTPNGLPVQQNYVKMKNEVIKLRFNKSQLRFYNLVEDGEQVDSKAQKNGISPNFIHSMDATHLQRVVLAEKQMGNDNFMMIHDSFGTDCAHAGELYKTIRQEFIGLYKGKNHLKDFLDSVIYLIADEDKDDIPPLPSFGNLDLDVVANSDFCFA